MNADDDGFCEHFTIMRMTESKPDDLRILQAKGFIHVFDDRVLIITDWQENNYIQKDRYSPSKYLEMYKEEVLKLSEKNNDLSKNTENQPKNTENCIQDVYNMDTQVRLELGKDRKEGLMPASRATPVLKPRETKKTTRDLTPVTPEESKKYICETMPNDKRAHIRIMAHYFQRKGFIFDTVDAREVSIKRNAKVASDLVGHPITDVLGTMEWLDNNSKDYDWKLETVLKTIDHYRAAWAKVNNNQI